MHPVAKALLVWTLVSVVVGMAIGKTIRKADLEHAKELVILEAERIVWLASRR